MACGRVWVKVCSLDLVSYTARALGFAPAHTLTVIFSIFPKTDFANARVASSRLSLKQRSNEQAKL
jgi:hypothetical protein